ncbi:hypothetical protein CYMTET_10598 [Cymbomonas tetramitiformis]|uniref:Integrase catalytic domain-containing protein n=1 Tax=Cymbomonas tetramitiformis TaxID=36881 RepID=A0AAE0GP70_9CHLO|nr:hypothetical protein CYMTET_10598 [Cymbomonas tetramitiformis]
MASGERGLRDLVTGLPVTARNYDAAFATFTCKLSKMVHVVHMNFQDSSAEALDRLYFEHVWKLHGAPMKLVSDKDPRFQDEMWKELMRLMGTKVAMPTPYNPRSDGQAEHTNRAATGPSARREGGEGTAHEMPSKFAAQLEYARTKLHLAQQRQRLQFDLRHHVKAFQVGDLVWVEANHLTESITNRETYRKLSPRWHGPLPVTEVFFSDHRRNFLS